MLRGDGARGAACNEAAHEARDQHGRSDDESNREQGRQQGHAEQADGEPQQRIARLAWRHRGAEAGRIESGVEGTVVAYEHGGRGLACVTEWVGKQENSIGWAMSEGVSDSLSADGGARLLPLARIEDGGFAEAEACIEGEAESLVLHRDGADVRAWLNVCPHAGRRLDWAPGKFLKSRDGLLVCAAHGASFELVHGECVAGPCRGQRLRAVPTAVRDGHVVLCDPRADPDPATGVRTAG